MNIIYFIDFSLLEIILILAIIKVARKTYFNSKIGSIYKDKGGFEFPEFRVTKIKMDFDSKGNFIAKYEVTCSFFSKENARGFKYHRFYFYDKKDKYKIGDTLTFTNDN